LLVVNVILYSLSITVKLETNEYEIKEIFKDIKILTDTADIDFVLSENLNTLIDCKEHKNIKIVHHNYPFDKTCNSYMTINIHPNACFMAKAAIASKKQNNYWGMSSLLYENRPNNLEKMLTLANQLEFDSEQFVQDIKSEETLQELKKVINMANDLNIDATPTMIINGEQIVGVKPYYELKKILERHGAKK
jgi:protein-disulfide isomerase